MIICGTETSKWDNNLNCSCTQHFCNNIVHNFSEWQPDGCSIKGYTVLFWQVCWFYCSLGGSVVVSWVLFDRSLTKSNARTKYFKWYYMKQNFALCIIKLEGVSSWFPICVCTCIFCSCVSYRGLIAPLALIFTAEAYYITWPDLLGPQVSFLFLELWIVVTNAA